MSQLVEDLRRRLVAKERVAVVGGNTKSFLGGRLLDEPVSMLEHSGIVNYEPTELVLTAKSGTSLRDIESCLKDARQMLPFEPPQFGAETTIGGVMASGLSGPRRIHLGSARDCVLGVWLINGLGQHLKFGGEVMKNVAGYDLSRLSVGAYGTLGVLTEVSIKVLPIPDKERTQVVECSQAEAMKTLTRFGRRPYPISAAAYVEGALSIRLSGAASGVDSAAASIGGETRVDAADGASEAVHRRHVERVVQLQLALHELDGEEGQHENTIPAVGACGGRHASALASASGAGVVASAGASLPRSPLTS